MWVCWNINILYWQKYMKSVTFVFSHVSLLHVWLKKVHIHEIIILCFFIRFYYRYVLVWKLHILSEKCAFSISDYIGVGLTSLNYCLHNQSTGKLYEFVFRICTSLQKYARTNYLTELTSKWLYKFYNAHYNYTIFIVQLASDIYMRVVRSKHPRIVVGYTYCDIFHNQILVTASGFAIGLHTRNIGKLLLPYLAYSCKL